MQKMPIDFAAILTQMADAISKRIIHLDNDAVLMIGIRSGGLWIAKRLHELLGLNLPVGELNISFYRDDFSTLGLHPEVKPSKLPVDITDKKIILVDDVIYTGRTIRAAMNEIFDYGRPSLIVLAVLIDRGAHELPIRADIVGKSLTLKTGEHVKLSGPEPLALEIIKSG